VHHAITLPSSANVPVVLDFIENPEDFVGRLFPNRVQLLWPIDRDFDPAFLSFEDDACW